jgi:hypothetical protein
MDFLPDGTFYLEDPAALKIPDTSEGSGATATLQGPGSGRRLPTLDTSSGFIDDGTLRVTDPDALAVPDPNTWRAADPITPVKPISGSGSNWEWDWETGLVRETWMNTIQQDQHAWEKVGRSWDWLAGCCEECAASTQQSHGSCGGSSCSDQLLFGLSLMSIRNSTTFLTALQGSPASERMPRPFVPPPPPPPPPPPDPRFDWPTEELPPFAIGPWYNVFHPCWLFCTKEREEYEEAKHEAEERCAHLKRLRSQLSGTASPDTLIALEMGCASLLAAVESSKDALIDCCAKISERIEQSIEFARLTQELQDQVLDYLRDLEAWEARWWSCLVKQLKSRGIEISIKATAMALFGAGLRKLLKRTVTKGGYGGFVMAGGMALASLALDVSFAVWDCYASKEVGPKPRDPRLPKPERPFTPNPPQWPPR